MGGRLPYDGALLWHTDHVQAQELRAQGELELGLEIQQ